MEWRENSPLANPERVFRMLDRNREMSTPTRLQTGHEIETIFKGKRVRGVANRLYFRPKQETFHQFLIFLLYELLSREWANKERQKPVEERHVVLQWEQAATEFINRAEPIGILGQVKALRPSGDLQALLSFADDMYQLAHVFTTPDKPVLKRLRDPIGFQGARYEVFCASITARCGYDIDYIDDKTKKAPEFVARHKKTNEILAVEAKSRHRPGALGIPNREVNMAEDGGRADVERLIREALEQAPRDKPFVIFVDVNLPLKPEIRPNEKQWIKDVTAILNSQYSSRPDEFKYLTGVVATNYSWHYDGSRVSSDPEAVVYPNPYAEFGLSEEFWRLLDRALREYGSIPVEEARKFDLNARYPDLPPL